MASKNDIEAGKAYVTLYVKNSAFVKSLRNAEATFKAAGSNMQAVGASIMAAGAGIAAPLAAAVASFVNTGDELDKMSKRTGASVEALSELGFAAQQTGASLSTIEGAVTSMNGVLASATRVEAGAMDSLARLGLTADKLKGQTPDRQFEALANAIAGVSDPAERAARATAVFGGSAQQLLPMLSQGAAGIAKLRQQAQDAGATMTTAGASSAAALKQSYDALKASAMGVANAVGEALAPDIRDGIEAIRGVASAIVTWVRNNRDVVVTIAKVAAGLVVAGGAIAAAGVLVSSLGAVFGALASVATGAVTAIVAAFGLVLSPVGLVVAAIAGVVYVIKRWPEAFGSAGQQATALFSTLGGWATAAKQWFGEMADVFADTWQGIRDAIASGDLSLAAEVAFAGLRVAWVKVVAAFQSGWQNAKVFFLETWSGMQEVIAGGFVDAFAGLQTAWVNVVSFFESTWVNLVGVIKSAWWSFAQLIMPIMEAVVRSYGYLSGMAQEDIDAMVARGKSNAETWQQDAQKTREQAAQGIEQQRQERVASIESERVGARKALVSMFDAERAQIAQDAAAAIKAAEGEVDAARQRLAATTGRAGKQAATARAQSAAGVASPVAPTVSERIASVAGTFSAAGAMLMGGGGSNMERIAARQLKTQQELLKEQREAAAFARKLGILLTVR